MSCTACGVVDNRRLYARVGPKRRLCVGCWNDQRQPWPRMGPMSEQELLEHENRTRDRMTARGGTDRHLVRAGKT